MENLDEFIGTTEVVEMEHREVQREEESFICTAEGCETMCRPADEGINPFMRYCNSCNIKLHTELNDAIDAEVIEQFEEDQMDEGDGRRDDCAAPAAVTNLGAGTEDNRTDWSMDEISSSLMSLVRAKDNRQIATIRFGMLCLNVQV